MPLSAAISRSVMTGQTSVRRARRVINCERLSKHVARDGRRVRADDRRLAAQSLPPSPPLSRLVSSATSTSGSRKLFQVEGTIRPFVHWPAVYFTDDRSVCCYTSQRTETLKVVFLIRSVYCIASKQCHVLSPQPSSESSCQTLGSSITSGFL